MAKGLSIGSALTADINETDILRHDETDEGLANAIARMTYPEFPVPTGIIPASRPRPMTVC